jgi:protein-tyrosine phosphatase
MAVGRATVVSVIDLHTHLLPGIDDGPRQIADSVEMARLAVADGARAMVCTPHMHPKFPTRPEAVAAGVAALRAELKRLEVPLEIHTGGEISLEWIDRMTDDDLRAASIGGVGRWLLVELPFVGWPLGLADLLGALEVRGFRVVLAHPERNASVQAQPDRMRDLVGRGALVQLTASSFLGEHGLRAQAAAEALLRNGFAHILASDSHSSTWRPPGMAEGLRAAGISVNVWPDDLRWMVDDGPALIIAGKDVRVPRLVPERPRSIPKPRAPKPKGKRPATRR